jgi:hypothetical protein
MRRFLLLSAAFTTINCTEHNSNENYLPADNGRIYRMATRPAPKATRHHVAHHTGRHHSINTSPTLGEFKLSPQIDHNQTIIQSSRLPPPRSRRQWKSDDGVRGHAPETYHRDRKEPTEHDPVDEPSRRDHVYDKSKLLQKGDSQSYMSGSAWLRAPPHKHGSNNVEQFTVQNRLSPSRCDMLRRSSRYSADCNATGSGKPFPLLVTGVGRSGTSFLQV